MTTSASTPQAVILEPGSNGGMQDLFQANAERAMTKTIVILAELVRERNIDMPVFRMVATWMSQEVSKRLESGL